MNKCCGNCANWTKMRQQYRGKGFRGLCELYDLGWAASDHGKNCAGWTAIKYHRTRKHNHIPTQSTE